MGMRILVTGASGLVGSNLVAAAVDRGWEATGTWNSVPVRFEGADSAHLDAGNARACTVLASATSPDVIVHAAASVQLSRLESSDSLARANVAATTNTVAAATQVGARYVLVSSDWVFSGDRAPGLCWSEGDETGPVNAYGRTKLASERAVEACDLDWLVTRPANVYGINLSVPLASDKLEAHVWERSSLALRWVRRLQAGESIPAPEAIFQSPTYAWDHAQRTCDLIERGSHGVWHLAGPNTIHRRAYLQSLADAFECDRGLVVAGEVSDFLAACGDDPHLRLPANTGLCNTKAQATLGPGVEVDSGHRLMRAQLERALSTDRFQEVRT
jgi:dTDP-4-dehydrorhamnose reductase